MMKYFPYTGIGSRETPADIMDVMREIGKGLVRHGFTLRSGGAVGADSAFEEGHDEGAMECTTPCFKEIYLPWRGFNNHTSELYNWPTEQLMYRAEEIAASNHPAWHRCSQGARKLHTRNVAQVLGHKLNKPSHFVFCWTKDGKGIGGTGQALRIARTRNIPIYDLGKPNTEYVIAQMREEVLTLLTTKINDI